MLAAKFVQIAELKRAVRAARHARRIAAGLAKAIAAIALAGHALLEEVLRLAIRAAHHAHATADALALVLNHRAVGGLVDGAGRAILQANRIFAVVAACR